MEMRDARDWDDIGWDPPGESRARLEVLAPKVHPQASGRASPRDRAIWKALDALRERAARAAFFIVRHGVAESFAAKEAGPARSMRSLRISLDAPTPYGRAVETRAPSLGHDGSPDGSVLVCPVIVEDRILGLLHAEGLGPGADAAWGRAIAGALGTRLEEIFLERRLHGITRQQPGWIATPISR